MTNLAVESDQPIHQAIVAGDIGAVSEYLAHGGTPNVVDQYDCEPLFTAVKYDRLEIAEMLLAAGGNIFKRSKFRGSAFGAACWNWNLRMIDFCLRAGVNFNAVDQGKTVLDSLESQRGHLSQESSLKWQAAFDKLVSSGARYAKEL